MMNWEGLDGVNLPGDINAWGEDDLIPISAIQHFSYCPRQAALILMEMVWEENLYTLKGRFVHESVDQPGTVEREGIRVERALPLWSTRLGLIGKADIVEFYGSVPYPVDYKHGPRREKRHDDLQLCAQALCLEEMLGVTVPKGAIYHASSRRRREVAFTPKLRREVMEMVGALRKMLQEGKMPPPSESSRCRACSLVNSCVPDVLREKARLEHTLSSTFDILSEIDVTFIKSKRARSYEGKEKE